MSTLLRRRCTAIWVIHSQTHQHAASSAHLKCQRCVAYQISSHRAMHAWVIDNLVNCPGPFFRRQNGSLIFSEMGIELHQTVQGQSFNVIAFQTCWSFLNAGDSKSRWGRSGAKWRHGWLQIPSISSTGDGGRATLTKNTPRQSGSHGRIDWLIDWLRLNVPPNTL